MSMVSVSVCSPYLSSIMLFITSLNFISFISSRWLLASSKVDRTLTSSVLSLLCASPSKINLLVTHFLGTHFSIMSFEVSTNPFVVGLTCLQQNSYNWCMAVSIGEEQALSIVPSVINVLHDLPRSIIKVS